MNELDRRIAVEIMGEPEPPWQYGTIAGEYENLTAWKPIYHMWDQGDRMYKWEPIPFSSNLEYAMKAVDKWLDAGQRYQGLWLTLSYDRAPEARNEPWDAYFSDADDNTFYGEDGEFLGRYPGQTAPDAICNLLLALAELSREKP